MEPMPDEWLVRIGKDWLSAGLNQGLTLHCLIYASQGTNFSKSFEVTNCHGIMLGITVKKALAKSIAGKWDNRADELSDERRVRELKNGGKSAHGTDYF